MSKNNHTFGIHDPELSIQYTTVKVLQSVAVLGFSFLGATRVATLSSGGTQLILSH